MALCEIRGEATFWEDAPRSRKPSPLAVAEVAYDLESDPAPWMQGILTSIEPLLQHGHGVFGFGYQLSQDGTHLSVTNPVFRNCSPELYEALNEATGQATPQELLSFYTERPCQTITQVVRRLNVPSPGLAVLTRRLGIRDQLMVIAGEADGSGHGFIAPSSRVERFPSRTSGAFARVARHIAAAHRLRRALQRVDNRLLVNAEAILDPGGKLLHAEGDARANQQRAALSAAARFRSGEAAHLRRSNPEQALATWNALIEGRWSLVATTDRDGRRFLVARRNQPELQDPAALSPEERHALALIARGHSAKLVAYELGIAPSVLSARVKLALSKLGLRNRSELLRVMQSRPRPEVSDERGS